jgi:release factor glutamine methyltransferase
MSFLEPGGLLAVEVGAGQADDVEKILENAGFLEIRSITDLGGIRRVILGRSPLERPRA